MTNLTTWEQAAQFDPTNPTQKQYIYYTGVPGGYGSFYYNQVPTKSQLLGLNGFSDLPVWVQGLAVAAIGGALGFLGRAKLWPVVKPKLGLSGRRSRR